MDLSKPARPWTSADGNIPRDWNEQPPLLPSTIGELAARISVVSTERATAFRLWDPDHDAPNIAELLATMELPRAPYTFVVSPASATPIEHGYLECMRLIAADDGIAADEAIAAFARAQRDRYPDMERHLVACYGTLTPERAADTRFRTIDYPAFDLGSIALGLGLFVERVRWHVSIWCWSRVVNWHK